MLRCGHTFCQTCLEELKIPHKQCIPCPNCRVRTENVISTKSLPENDGIFNEKPMFGVNLNSPYETAKRLSRECETLISTGQRYLIYLEKMREHDGQSENSILQNYEQEYEKVEAVSQMLIQMINDYKEKLQKRLTESMVRERGLINQHYKEIEEKREDVKEILDSVQEVSHALEEVKENEQAFMKQQMEEYYIRQQQEQQNNIVNPCQQQEISCKTAEAMIGQQAKQYQTIQTPQQQQQKSGQQKTQSLFEDNSSNSSHKHSSSEETESIEKEDRIKVQNIRTTFYQLNERFEGILKFQPIRKLQKWQTEMNLDSSYNIFSAIKLEEKVEPLNEQMKELEILLDLRDYYDIKRPTVVFFRRHSKQIRVKKFDVMSGSIYESIVKPINISSTNPINIKESKAISHPSNNSVFLVDGPQIYHFDNQNDILLQKPYFNSIAHIRRQALCYNEGFIYFVGGQDITTQRSVKTCARYNIVIEKWQMIAPLLFDKMDASIYPMNEYQIVVAGGMNSQQKLTDLIEIYDARENQWKLFEIGLSSPRRLMSMVSSQKDRVIIVGGREKDGAETRTVEEIDFLKRNSVSLENLKWGRSIAQTFLVNDTIFTFWGFSNGQEVNQGEKYVIRENKWKEVGLSEGGQNKKEFSNLGPAALLYE